MQIETVRVFASTYGLSKTALQGALGAIAEHPAFHLQRPDVFQAAFQHYLAGHADFADGMILAESESAGHELATFDRKLGKLPGVHLIPR